ncbi:MAG: YdjY domain-containing protein [Planctomycetota bacterium]|nr:YdjY domain-containing protein [Planctomycetota bacterium]
MNASAITIPFALLCAVTCAQEPGPVPVPVPPKAPQKITAQDTRQLALAMQQQFAAEGIVVDAKAQTVTIKATMNQPPDPIEYLLIHKKGKRHEALFITGSKPSVLNAALLLLGLKPGKNASVREKNPPPTLEEIERGVDPVIVTPPQGDELFLTVRWQDAAGKAVEYCIEDLLVDLQAQDVMQAGGWIFLGGRMAQLYKNEPEVFIADFEGNLISICYLSPDNHLATLRHERARDDQNWWFTKFCPDSGTEVEIVFWKQKPQILLDRDKRLAELAKQQPPVTPKPGPPKDGVKDAGK